MKVPRKLFTNSFGWLLLVFLLSCAPAWAAEPRNLLTNPDFSAGSAKLPDAWSQQQIGASVGFDWLHPQESPPQLSLTGDQSNSGRLKAIPCWSQKVDLDPGWYYLTTQARTEDDSVDAGAMLMVCSEPRIATQIDPHANPVCGRTASLHSQSWKELGTYLRVSEPGQSFDIQLGVGPHGGTTRAYFRSAKLIYTGLAPAEDKRKIDFPQLQLRRSGYRLLVDRSSLLSKILSLQAGVEFILGLIALTFLDHWFITDARDLPDPDTTSVQQANLLDNQTTASPVPTWTSRLAELKGSIAVALIFTTAFLGIYVIDRVDFVAGLGIVHEHPGVVAGDEPHYLIVLNSILLDHDLELQDDYARVAEGGSEAGARFRGVELDHHTVVINRRTGRHSVGASFNGIWHRNPSPQFAPSRDVYEVSGHPITFPALLALTIWPFHPAPGDVEEDASIALGAISWLGVLATYFMGRRIGLSRFLAVSAALLLLLASPWLAYARSYFRETTIGLTLVLAMWAAITDFPITSAIAVVAVAALRPAYIFVGACFVEEEFREGRWRISARMALALGVSLLAFVIFSLWLRRTILKSGVRLLFRITGRYDTLFDPANGLLVFVPWTAIGLWASFGAALSFEAQDRVLRRMATPLALNLFATSAFAPGFCYGPRYWVPFLPWLSVATVLRLQRAGLVVRVLAGILILLSIGVAIPGALCYPDIFTKTPLQAWRMISGPPVAVTL